MSTTTNRIFQRLEWMLAAAMAAAAVAPSPATAQTFTTIVNLNYGIGTFPQARVIADANGNLFGATTGGGANDIGTVFEIPKTAGGYGDVTVLVSFNGSNGANPNDGLLLDANGNLFGAAAGGGTNNNGTVFEIPKTAGGYGDITVLASFNGSNGADPISGLIIDANGNLFGTTCFGGTYNEGTVFEIARTASSYASTPTVLVSFTGSNGAKPIGGLVADPNGNLFGTTSSGGTLNYGTVFEIANTAGSYASTPTILVNFTGSNGSDPFGDLIADANGNLFGTTATGGTNNSGTVFEIANTAGSYAGAPTVLFNFDYTHGEGPSGSLIADANGNLFGTTSGGGALGYGTVFEIANMSGSYASTPTTLHNFSGQPSGSVPLSGLFADANGNLFGTTNSGGIYNDGTVFEISLVTFTGAPASAAYGSSFQVTATTNANTLPVITASGPCSVGSVSGSPASATATVTMTGSTGACELTSNWAADSKFKAATLTQYTNAMKATTGVQITAHAPNPSMAGQAVTVNFSVSPQFSGTPGGTVTVSATTGESCMGSAPSGSCMLTFLTAGTRTITASYGGDANFLGGTSNGVTQAVWDFTVSATPASQTIPPGHSATITMTIAPLNGFTGAVALSCSGGLAGSTCTISPAQVTLTGSSSVTATGSSSVTATGSSSAKATVTITLPKDSPGTFNFTLKATSAGASHSTTVSVTEKS